MVGYIGNILKLALRFILQKFLRKNEFELVPFGKNSLLKTIVRPYPTLPPAGCDLVYMAPPGE